MFFTTTNFLPFLLPLFLLLLFSSSSYISFFFFFLSLSFLRSFISLFSSFPLARNTNNNHKTPYARCCYFLASFLFFLSMLWKSFFLFSSSRYFDRRKHQNAKSCFHILISLPPQSSLEEKDGEKKKREEEKEDEERNGKYFAIHTLENGRTETHWLKRQLRLMKTKSVSAGPTSSQKETNFKEK